MTEPPIDEADLDRATDREYAAVSVPAVLGVVFAALGVVAFLAAPLVSVPILAAVLSAVALRRIRRSRGVLTGRRLALAGLALGLGLTLLAGGYHAWTWYGEYQTLETLKRRTHEVGDDLVARNYGTVFDRMPDGSPQRERGLDAFRAHLTRLFAGAGDPVGRSLRSLQILRTDRGEAIAAAELRLDLTQRTLEFQLWFRPDEEGRWQFIGVGGRETLESASRRGADPVAPMPGPYLRG
jgi:hypothetical protein